MDKLFWSIIFLVFGLNTVVGQQVYWVHQPFSRTVFEGSYVKDSVVFEPTEQIWGIVNQSEQQITLLIKNAYQLEQEITLNTQSFQPDELKWHPLIQKYWKPVLQNKDWKYFELLKAPTVQDAYQGVALVELFDDVLKKKVDPNKKQPFYYKNKESNAEFQMALFDFSRGKGELADLIQQMNYYKGIIATRHALRAKQLVLEQSCTPAGFAQVKEWAAIQVGLKTTIQEQDYQLFVAIEKMKIKTENTDGKLTALQKRKLRSLFLLDISLLEATTKEQKAMLSKQRTALVQQLNIYPALKNIIQTYESLLKTPKQAKTTEERAAKNLIEVKQQFKRYEGKWKAHQEIQAQIDALDEQLEAF